MLTLRDWARFPLTFWSASVILTVSVIFSELIASYFEMSSGWANDNTAEWRPLTSLHSTPQVTWSVWGVILSLFWLILQNELTFDAKSPNRWRIPYLNQKFACFSWPWHLGHQKSHEEECNWERNPPWAVLIFSAPTLRWACQALLESPWSLLRCLEHPAVYSHPEPWPCPAPFQAFELWPCRYSPCSLTRYLWTWHLSQWRLLRLLLLTREGWTRDSLWLQDTQWPLLTIREMTVWHHQMTLVVEHEVLYDHEQTYWCLLLFEDESPIWTFFPLLMMMWLSSLSLTWISPWSPVLWSWPALLPCPKKWRYAHRMWTWPESWKSPETRLPDLSMDLDLILWSVHAFEHETCDNDS